MKRLMSTMLVTAVSMLALSGCTAHNAGEPTAPSTGASDSRGEVTLIAHDSLSLPDELAERFHEKTGYTLNISQLGSGGEAVNQLVLTKNNPLGDVAVVDNLLAYRAVSEGVFAEDRVNVVDEAYAQAVPGAPGLVAFDQGDVCVNVDHEWFTQHGIDEPRTFDDLADPQYKDLLVAMNPTSSSPGMAFLAATISQFGDNWGDYWKRLVDNGMTVTRGWSDAFNVNYSAGPGKGQRPLMVSYSSSPAYAVNDDMTASSTGALLDTCFHQVEYLGILTGAANPEGAKALIEFLLSTEAQEMISQENYMFPINPEAKAPEALVKFGPMASTPHQLDSQTIVENQQKWLTEWTEITSR